MVERLAQLWADRLRWHPTANPYVRAALWAAGLGLAAAVLIFGEPSLLVNGLLLGSALALAAIGVTLIFGILGFAHFAHGDFMTLGAFIAYALLVGVFPALGLTQTGWGPFTFGFPLLLALPAGVLAAAALAAALDWLIYRHLRRRLAAAMTFAIAALGVAFALRAVIRGTMQASWDTQIGQLPRESRQFIQLPLDIGIPPDNIFLGLAAALLVVGLYLFLSRTRAGKAMRATADNPDLARVSGVNTQLVIYWTWALGAGLAAVAGTLIAVSQAQFTPLLGWKILIPIFAAVILGGIGSLYGALLGALLISVAMEVSTQWISPSYKPAVAFIIMLVVLLIRPQGILGKSAQDR